MLVKSMFGAAGLLLLIAAILAVTLEPRTVSELSADPYKMTETLRSCLKGEREEQVCQAAKIAANEMAQRDRVMGFSSAASVR